MCRLLPRSRDLPRIPGGSASILKLSRPAQTSLALRPAGSLSRPRRPLSRGSGPASRPAKPLVSYQINRQLSGWNLLHWQRTPSGRTGIKVPCSANNRDISRPDSRSIRRLVSASTRCSGGSEVIAVAPLIACCAPLDRPGSPPGAILKHDVIPSKRDTL